MWGVLGAGFTTSMKSNECARMSLAVYTSQRNIYMGKIMMLPGYHTSFTEKYPLPKLYTYKFLMVDD